MLHNTVSWPFSETPWTPWFSIQPLGGNNVSVSHALNSILHCNCNNYSKQILWILNFRCIMKYIQSKGINSSILHILFYRLFNVIQNINLQLRISFSPKLYSNPSGKQQQSDVRIQGWFKICAQPQWETTLLCNNVSHWLGASLESALGYNSILSSKPYVLISV